MSTTLTDSLARVAHPLPILEPGDPGWDAARGTFNTLTDQRPDAIALPRTALEVAEVIRWARDRGLRVVPQSTGHNAAPLGDLTGALLVRTSELDEVEIDADARRVRVGTAVRWDDVAPQLSDLGLAALHGSSPDVGIAGYSLGGGIGWLARRYGMQTNAVQAFELVTADGELIRADSTRHPELFWALRGGGGNFGVVTAIEFAVFPVRELYTGALFFPVEATVPVLQEWNRMLDHLPEAFTTWVTVLHFPPFDDVPEAVRGKSFTVVMGAFLGDEEHGRALLAPFHRLGPAMDTFAMQPPVALARLAMDPETPLPFRSATALLDGLTPEAIEQLGALAQRPELTMIQLRHGGGALGRAPEGAGVRATLPGEIVLFSLGVVPEPGADPVVQGLLAQLAAAVADARVGDYPNFVEDPRDARGFYDDASWEHLRRIKAAYDPGDLIRGNFHIPPAAAQSTS